MTRPVGAVVPSRRALVTIWVAAAVGLATLLAVAESFEGPLDDPDPAHQRPGFLDAFGLPQPAAPLPDGLPASGRATVVFFERAGRLGQLCDALALSGLAEIAALAIVVPTADESCDAAMVSADPAVELARTYGLRRPADGGPPVGYAVVDGRGRIRYRTLDPAVAEELSEVRTIVEALR